MKVRIGIGDAGHDLSPAALEGMCTALVENGFDSIWISEVLSQPGVDPLVALGWLAGRLPTLKIGTTFLVPGRNVLRLARQLATLDHLSAGRLLLTAVPGLPRGGEKTAVGVDPKERGRVLDATLPVLASLLRGDPTDVVSPAGTTERVILDPLPAQDPLEIWLGGSLPSALDRCGRLADGWLPAMITPADAAVGKEQVAASASAAGRSIDPEHFGVSIGYSFNELPTAMVAALQTRAKTSELDGVVPVGASRLRALLEDFIDIGFTKFVLRPLTRADSWEEEMSTLASAVGDLQT